MPEVKIKAEPRTEFGKGAARRIRRADKVPAVIYGHGGEPVHVTLPGYDIMMALKNTNALMSIEVDGKSQLTLPKQVQRETLRGFIEHVDLIIVTRGEKVFVDIPVHVVGDAAPGSLVVTEQNSVSLQVEATHIPEYVEVSVEGLDVGDHIVAKDITLPSGAELHLDEETLIVNVAAAPTAEEVEAELEEAEAEAGIEREEHEQVGEEAAAAVTDEAAEDDQESSTQE